MMVTHASLLGMSPAWARLTISDKLIICVWGSSAMVFLWLQQCNTIITFSHHFRVVTEGAPSVHSGQDHQSLHTRSQPVRMKSRVKNVLQKRSICLIFFFFQLHERTARLVTASIRNNVDVGAAAGRTCDGSN
jgi:hypothetical protein